MTLSDKLMVSRWERGCGLSEKIDMIKKYKFPVIKTVMGCKVQPGINNTVTTMEGVRWVLGLSG